METTAFVDKTLFIKEVFKHNFILITAPKKFGKSTNMDMLKTFLEIVVDKHGHPISNIEEDSVGHLVEKSQTELTTNFKLFKKHNLSVYQDKQFFYKHCGRLPVIYINFKIVNVDTFDEVLESLRTVLHDTFQQHGYLLNCTELWLADNENTVGKFYKKSFIKYWDAEKHKNLSKTEIQCGLTFLSGVLHKHFNIKVFVLLDEFDSLIFDLIFDSDLEVGKTVKFIKKLTSLLLENNPHVDRALINACTHLAKVLSSSNIEHFPFLYNYNFAEFYGFKEREVEKLIKKFNMSHTLEEIESWYGYKTLGKANNICRVSSIINYLNLNALKSYWSETDNIKLKHIFLNKEIQAIIEKVLNGEAVVVEQIRKTEVEQILCLKNLTNSPLPSEKNPSTVSKENIDLFLQFLYDCGYFTIINVIGEKMLTTYLKLQIPNKEVNQELSHNIHICHLLNLLKYRR